MVCITYREYRPTCIERNYGSLIPKHLKAKCFVPYNTECEKLGENMHVPAPNVLMNLALSKNADKICKPCHPVMEDGNAPVGVRCCFPKPVCKPCPKPPPCKPCRPQPCKPLQRPCCRTCKPDPCCQPECKDPCSSSSESCDEDTNVCSEGRSPKMQTSQTSIHSSKYTTEITSKTTEPSSKKTVKRPKQRTRVCQPCFVPCPPCLPPRKAPKPSYCIGKNKLLGALKYDCHHPNCGPFITTPSGQKIFSQKRENMKGTQYVWSQKKIDDMIFKPDEIECYTNIVQYQTEMNETSETETSCNDLISIKNYEIKCAMIESRLFDDRSLKNDCGDWTDDNKSVGIQWSERDAGAIDRQLSTSSLLKMETKKEACTSTPPKMSSSQLVEPKSNCVRLFLDIPQNLISGDERKESTSDQILDMGSKTFSEFLDRLCSRKKNLEKCHMRDKRSESSSECRPIHQQTQTSPTPLIVGNVTCDEPSTQSVSKKFLIKTVKRIQKKETDDYDSDEPSGRKKFKKRIRPRSRQKISREPSEKISVYDIYDDRVNKPNKISSEENGSKRKRSEDKDQKSKKTAAMQDSMMTGRSIENRVSSLYYDRTSQDLTNGLFYNQAFQHYSMFHSQQRPFITLDDLKTDKPRRKKRWYFEGIRYAARK